MKTNGAAPDVGSQADLTSEQWQQRCAELTAERDQLRQQLAALRGKYEELRGKYEPVLDSLCHLMGLNEEVDLEALRAQMGKGPSLREFLDELEAEYNLKGAS
jgi:hypothetical protein